MTKTELQRASKADLIVTMVKLCAVIDQLQSINGAFTLYAQSEQLSLLDKRDELRREMQRRGIDRRYWDN